MIDQKANYEVLVASAERIILKDLGPWDQFMSITNAAESVITEIDRRYLIGKRRVLYYDSEGEPGELLVKNRRFAGFAPAKI